MQLNAALLTMAMKAGMFPVDDAVDSNDPTIHYYSFANERGDFYIMQIKSSDNGNEYRYAMYSKGTTYSTVWSIRESISYDYPWEARR